MSDMLPTIVPKSDQLNADSLIGGPITITITNVTVSPGEQPVSLHYEGENGRPYKPCKSMCRVLVQLWGADGKKYVGKSLTLYRDPTVKFGGMQVGGIRISHMSDIGDTMTLALTASKGKRAPFVVKPLATQAASKPKKSVEESVSALVVAFVALGVPETSLEKKLGKPMKDIVAVDLVVLREVYAAIRDGRQPITDFFPDEQPSDSKAALEIEDEANRFAEEIAESAGNAEILASISSRLGEARPRLGKHYKRLVELHARSGK